MTSFAASRSLEGLGGPIRLEGGVTQGGIDPTLESCCQRELQSNRHYNALTRTLQRHDVVAQAERRRRHLVKIKGDLEGCRCCYDPNSDGGEYLALYELRERRRKEQSIVEGEGEEDYEEEKEEDKIEREPAAGTSSTEENSDSDSDDEFDYLLDEPIGGGGDSNDNSLLKQAEERRRAELEMMAFLQTINQQHGYGVHRQLHPTRVLHAAGLGGKNAPPAVVLHLVDPESLASASLDLFLEELAMGKVYGMTPRGTKFMRSGGRSTLLLNADLATRVLPRLRVDRDLPALIAIRDGVVVNSCPRLSGLTTRLDDEVDTDAVYQWLDRCGVLLQDPPRLDEVCRIRPEEEALLDVLVDEQRPPEEERYDCGNPNCHKTFPHEHVGMQNEQQSGLVVSEQEVLGGKE